MSSYEVTDAVTGHRMIVCPFSAWQLTAHRPVVYPLAAEYLRDQDDFVVWISVPSGQESVYGRGHFTVNYEHSSLKPR